MHFIFNFSFLFANPDEHLIHHELALRIIPFSIGIQQTQNRME